MITFDQFLIDERTRDIRHEFANGFTFQHRENILRHGLIAGNLIYFIAPLLDRTRLEIFSSRVLLRINSGKREFGYYPDVMISPTDAVDTDPWYVTKPLLLIEIMSPETRRIDRAEKLYNYMDVPSLKEYLLIDQDHPMGILQRRRTDWSPEITIGLYSSIHLESVDLTIPLSRVYENIAGIA